MAFRHRKKRNAGLLYEFLAHQATYFVVTGDKKGARQVIEIAKKYFAPGLPLAEEKRIFDFVRNTRGVGSDTARSVLDEIRCRASEIDREKVEIKKSNLIKEVNYSFGKQFFERRIPEYRFLATVGVLLDLYKNGDLVTEGAESRALLEDSLSKYMQAVEEIHQPFVSDDGVDGLAVEFASDRFDKKYGGLLEEQRKLLERHNEALLSENYRNFMSRTVLPLIAQLKKRLTAGRLLREVSSDPVMMERLDQALVELDGVLDDPDTMLEKLMLHQKLAHELESEDQVDG